MLIAEMSNIVKRYGSSRVLDHVDIVIDEGEILGLLGPNGAGKTTLIHSLAGLIKTDSGEIKVFNEELQRNLSTIKSKIGLVTQEVTVFEDLTARENLEFFGGIYGLRGEELKKRVEETLRFVGLMDRAKQLPTKFSGGMKRRLNIACALVHEPKLIIMDEPTVGIDPQSRNHILESIRKLQQNGTTILYTTHYIEEVQAIASRVVVMDQGHVIAEGTVDELVENIQHEEKVQLEVEEGSEELAEQLQKINGVKQVIRNGDRFSIISRTGSGNLDRVLTVAKSTGGVKSINVEKPTLEDVFLTLTGKTLRDREDN
ncbi:ABC-2 type transport system ATP-binding protein [Virgibacillus natechei]|uniref:ABC-2 type transport system ATP-binding protein n=1 Tax=Virgibacillus natechei TaxID=1216297 RepID=A0ABS4IE02_9BACI|nr:ABC transporter ATP-binding protein [Virgibacillus natechei]MBP1969083.1 ABC-2 type transport system ATP-binding protein [Virgibacillus natechei]UZD14350.1 ABC transporter ATP-binding protein [Virgibacillus natechei]